VAHSTLGRSPGDEEGPGTNEAAETIAHALWEAEQALLSLCLKPDEIIKSHAELDTQFDELAPNPSSR
jgi:hypothetical protein